MMAPIAAMTAMKIDQRNVLRSVGFKKRPPDPTLCRESTKKFRGEPANSPRSRFSIYSISQLDLFQLSSDKTNHIEIDNSIINSYRDIIATVPVANANAPISRRAHVRRSGDVFHRMHSTDRRGWWHLKDSVDDAGVDAARLWQFRGLSQP